MIKSILDNDFYKFTMQQAVLDLFPNAVATYKFKNRGKHRFNQRSLDLLKSSIENISNLSLDQEEYTWLKNNIKFFKPLYIEYLKNYKYDPDQVSVKLNRDNDLEIDIQGPWHSTILWEVPLMSMISQSYFEIVDTNWDIRDAFPIAAYKGEKFRLAECRFAEFGTRRRRSFDVQDFVLQGLLSQQSDSGDDKRYGLIGTSNVYFAKKFNIPPIGTMAHEWIQATQSLESINHCNYHAMDNWIRVYNCDLGIALTDTITTDMFLKNFNKRFAMSFSGVRHDSGCPYEFTDKIINCYKKHKIDPMSKTIIFSDGLNIEQCISLKSYCHGRINCSFGIGTYLTNDFRNSPALNMVIKLWTINDVPVVKLSDDEGKENGDKSAIQMVKKIVSYYCW